MRTIDGEWVRAAVLIHARNAMAALVAATREFGYGRLRLRSVHRSSVEG